jgi:hypothetical protein
MHQFRNLLFLSYTHFNSSNASLIMEIPSGVTLDLNAGTWSFEGKTYKIGTQRRRCDWGSQLGPIGVYDRSDITHLRNMLTHHQYALESPGSALAD